MKFNDDKNESHPSSMSRCRGSKSRAEAGGVAGT